MTVFDYHNTVSPFEIFIRISCWLPAVLLSPGLPFRFSDYSFVCISYLLFCHAVVILRIIALIVF